MTFDRKTTARRGGEQEVTGTLAVPLHAPEEVLRTMFAEMLQTAVASEFNRFMVAAPYERSEQRTGWRNGYKPRTLKTRVGTIELRIPQDRSGQFSPSLFERYERSEKAFMFSLTEMYLQGISTRKVTKVVEELCGTTVSASEISLLVKKLDTELAAWRNRPLDGQVGPGHASRVPVSEVSTSITGHSRVKASTRVNALNTRPSASVSRTKSMLHRSFCPPIKSFTTRATATRLRFRRRTAKRESPLPHRFPWRREPTYS